MATPQVQALMREVRQSAPGLSDSAVERAVKEFIESGTTLPQIATAIQGSVLIKVVPKGEVPSATSGYFMTPAQAQAVALMSPQQAATTLGLRAQEAARVMTKGMDFLAITPKTGNTPTVFVSDIADASQGKINLTAKGQQVIVPNRSLWSEPKPVNPFTLQ
jgi:filamentous hemagglutinin